ncbi:NUDIX hydrolase [Candidatus Kuenenbacteria bacterium]|nr:NUDIX hydrolase [Candidatus Kuenenbacteria bacterium]
MVVEQRPAQSRYKTNKKALIQGKTIDLDVFGPHSSLEFPGGAVDPGEGLKAGFLRELQEETGVKEQTALCYQRIAPCNGFGSELALHTHWGVIYLSGLRFEREVDTDGGLSVMALTRGEVQANIWSGVITSGQGGLTCWSFLQEVEQIKEDPELQKYLIDIGYLSVEELQLTNL